MTSLRTNRWVLDWVASVIPVITYAYLFVGIDSATGEQDLFVVGREILVGVFAFGIAALLSAWFTSRGFRVSSWIGIGVGGSVLYALSPLPSALMDPGMDLKFFGTIMDILLIHVFFATAQSLMSIVVFRLIFSRRYRRMP